MTDNQRAVGNALQIASEGSLSANGQTVLGAIETLDSPGARSAFDTLSGEGLAAVENVALMSSQLFLSNLRNQGLLWRSPNATGAPNGATGANSTDGQESGVWGTVFDSRQHYGGNSTIGSSVENDTVWGVAAGVDQAVTSNLLVGIALGGSDGDFSVTQGQTAGSVHGFHAGAYSVLDLDPVYTAVDFAYSSYSNQAQRTIAGFGGLAGENVNVTHFGADEIRGRFELGGRMQWSSATITPYAAMEGAHLWSQGFIESVPTGAPALLGLTVDPHSTNSEPLFLGTRFENHLEMGSSAVLIPSIDLAWVHEFSDRRDLTATLTSLPGAPFTIDGARPPRNGTELHTGVELLLPPHAALYANFEGEFAGNGDTYAGNVGMRFSW
jgi:outer membrane autotransporter protein